MAKRANFFVKFIDKYVGISLIVLIGLFRKKQKKLPNQIDSIAIIQFPCIGDTILTSVIIHELKLNFSNSKIILICSEANYSVVKLLSSIDEIIIFHPSKIFNFFFETRKKSYDLIIDSTPWPRISALIATILKGKYKIGFNREKMHKHYAFDLAVKHKDSLHEIDNHRNLLKSINIKIHKVVPQLTLNDDIDISIPSFSIIFHPFSGGSKALYKQWPQENWIELGKKLILKGYCIYITGSKKDAAIAKKISEEIHSTKCHSVAGMLSLKETATLIKKVNKIVTIDTGIMHLAAALDVIIIALYGPTSKKRWGPLSTKANIITSPISCKGCLSLGFESLCNKPIGSCMAQISVNTVLNAISHH